MTKIIKGTFNYEIHITDSSFELKTTPEFGDEFAAIIIANMITSYSKDTIMKSLDNAKGNDINLLRDRLGKVNSTMSILQLMGSDYAREAMLMTDAIPADENLPTEEPLMGLEDIAKLNNS